MPRVFHTRIDMTGQRIGRLTVLRYAETRDNGAHWVCICDCGQETTVLGSALRRISVGGTRSCGCIKREMLEEANTTHGFTHHPYYVMWRGMIDRCYNPVMEMYPIYGGRGIYVCDEWKNTPEKFIDWCKSKEPIPNGNSIDRYPDLNGPYSPDNCRFASAHEQNRNRRDNVWVEYNGERLIFKDFVEKYGLVSVRGANKRIQLHNLSRIDAALMPPFSRRVKS